MTALELSYTDGYVMVEAIKSLKPAVLAKVIEDAEKFLAEKPGKWTGRHEAMWFVSRKCQMQLGN